MSLESYAHKTAKEVFAGWLRDVARERCGGDDSNGNPVATFGPLYWRVNRGGPHFGVWVEYPIGRQRSDDPVNRDGINQVWDEVTYDPDPSLECPGSPWESRPPTLRELTALGSHPEFIADIAIQHKGRISAVIEIVHKNPPDTKKIKAYFDIGLHFLIVPTRWVLGQVRRPSIIPREFYAWDPK